MIRESSRLTDATRTMRIRDKLLAGVLIAVCLLLVQMTAVGYFVRELQAAVRFISSAQAAIEADFVASETVQKLRAELKKVASNYVAHQETKPAGDGTALAWQELSSSIEIILGSDAARMTEPALLSSLRDALSQARQAWQKTTAVAGGPADLDALIERVIVTDRALAGVYESLAALALELRKALQAAVERERAIHDRPMIAGVAVGGLVIILLLAFTWLYVDRGLVARLTALSESMRAIAGGNLRAPLPPPTGRDEIAGMANALRVFRDTAVEVEDQALRERQVVLDTIEYGVLILNSELKVRMHNRALRELWNLTEEHLRGRPSFPELLESLRSLGLHGVPEDDWPSYIERRIAEIRNARVPPHEWVRPDGRVLQYEIVALPDGGRMLTYFDLTHVKRVESELRAAKEQAELRTRELASSLAQLHAAQDRLVQTEKLASLGQLTAGIAHEIKNPLNFVNNFSAVSGELVAELREALHGASLDDTTREQVEELAELVESNLEKVVQHGKRADSIVRNMLLHSRTNSGEHRPVEINAIVEESLNLAYHGARAVKQDFNITLERNLDSAAGEIDLFPQEMTRVLLNLISNGFYATAKRGAEANGAPYRPTLVASTKDLGDRVEIRIRDNGTGIPPAVREKMFDPFFTTKPAGEGTGLGEAACRHNRSRHEPRRVHRVPDNPATPCCFRSEARRSRVSLHILVVDDEPDVETLFRQQFRREIRAGRFAMDFARSGGAALERIGNSVDASLILILSDINMPGMSGLELLPQAKAVLPDVPIVIITAYGDPETRRKALEGGAEALLTKPIDFVSLRSDIETRLERAA